MELGDAMLNGAAKMITRVGGVGELGTQRLLSRGTERKREYVIKAPASAYRLALPYSYVDSPQSICCIHSRILYLRSLGQKIKAMKEEEGTAC